MANKTPQQSVTGLEANQTATEANTTHKDSDGSDHANVATNTSNISALQIGVNVISVSNDITFTGASGTMTTDTDRDLATIAGIEPRNGVIFSLVGSGSLTVENCTGFVYQSDTFPIRGGQRDLYIWNRSETGTPAYMFFDIDRATIKELGFALGDETSDITTGTAKLTFAMPNYATLLLGVSVNVKTAPTGTTAIFDLNEAGTTVLSTKISIDISETNSETAATPPVISDSAIAANAIMTMDIDQVGSTVAGVAPKCWIYFIKA